MKTKVSVKRFLILVFISFAFLTAITCTKKSSPISPIPTATPALIIVTAIYNYGSWGPCPEQVLTYQRTGDNYDYIYSCVSTGVTNTPVALTADQFNNTVYMADFLASFTGFSAVPIPAGVTNSASECFQSADGSSTVCENSSGIIVFKQYITPPGGPTDENTLSSLVSYTSNQ